MKKEKHSFLGSWKHIFQNRCTQCNLCWKCFRHLWLARLFLDNTFQTNSLFSSKSPTHDETAPNRRTALPGKKYWESKRKKEKHAQLSLTMIFRILKCINKKEAHIVSLSRWKCGKTKTTSRLWSNARLRENQRQSKSQNFEDNNKMFKYV